MRLVCISDTHNYQEQISLPDGDILLHAGDMTAIGTSSEFKKVNLWLKSIEHKFKDIVLIAGNHDIGLCPLINDFKDKQRRLKVLLKDTTNVHYLEDTSVVIDGLKIHGYPWTPESPSNRRWGFSFPRNNELINSKLSLIPKNTDILLSHGPPANILDKCAVTHIGHPVNAGCELLRHYIEELPQLKHVVMGHIHEGRGHSRTLEPTQCWNVSTCTRQYQPTNSPVIIDV